MSTAVKALVISIVIVFVLVGIPVFLVESNRADACHARGWESYRYSMCVDQDGYVRLPYVTNRTEGGGDL